ncbi:hypothetical protein ACFUOZ_02765 [Paenarthrobacter sp. NPDC057355]|uniref:hypothetical protein n=1 Tax=Paenarthrobacter sp. NPDC057355 TaxID=3346105 RepID=UPI00363B316D
MVEASGSLRRAAGELAELSGRLDRPSGSGQVLGALMDTQRSIEHVLRELAQWHQGAMPGVHFAEHHDESVSGVSLVVEQLDLAVQQAAAMQETLSLAYEGSGAVRWFDEEQESSAQPVLPS